MSLPTPVWMYKKAVITVSKASKISMHWSLDQWSYEVAIKTSLCTCNVLKLYSMTLRIEIISFELYWSLSLKDVRFLRRGGSGPKFLKTSFRVNDWPKRMTQWANFLVGSWGPRPFGATVAATPIFPPKIRYFLKKHQNQDFSLPIGR